MKTDNDKFFDRIKANPELRARFEAILDIDAPLRLSFQVQIFT